MSEYGADPAVVALAVRCVTDGTSQVQMSTDLLEQLADAVVPGRIVVSPVTKIEFEDVASAMNDGRNHHGGKTVITL